MLLSVFANYCALCKLIKARSLGHLSCAMRMIVRIRFCFLRSIKRRSLEYHKGPEKGGVEEKSCLAWQFLMAVVFCRWRGAWSPILCSLSMLRWGWSLFSSSSQSHVEAEMLCLGWGCALVSVGMGFKSVQQRARIQCPVLCFDPSA